MKLPAMQFYPGDWWKDPCVSALSCEERGIWFQMLLLMFEGEERGRLTLNGKPMPEDALARVIGLSTQRLRVGLTHILGYGVASIDDNGVIYSRRMIRDEQARLAAKEYGKRGGNPVLVNPTPTTPLTPPVKPNLTPSSSSSSSSSELTPPPSAREAQPNGKPSVCSVPRANFGPWNTVEVDPQQAVAVAVETVAKIWPKPGDKRYATAAWEREAAQSAHGVMGWCERIVETAKAHAVAHTLCARAVKGHFIPTLERWVTQGDYTSPPPKPIRFESGPIDLGDIDHAH